ncbi:MAG: hypothetical protein WAJ93_24575, partial [Candidatus Nitrosopolaris sp.]
MCADSEHLTLQSLMMLLPPLHLNPALSKTGSTFILAIPNLRMMNQKQQGQEQSVSKVRIFIPHGFSSCILSLLVPFPYSGQ